MHFSFLSKCTVLLQKNAQYFYHITKTKKHHFVKVSIQLIEAFPAILLWNMDDQRFEIVSKIRQCMSWSTGSLLNFVRMQDNL